MVIEKVVCDRCTKELHGNGFTMEYDVSKGRFRLVVTSAIRETGGSHICGKNCLMLTPNALVDEISEEGSPALFAEAAQKGNYMKSISEKGECEIKILLAAGAVCLSGWVGLMLMFTAFTLLGGQ